MFMLLEVKDWGQESHLNQAMDHWVELAMGKEQDLDLVEQVLDLADMGLVVLGQVVLAQEQVASDQVVLAQESVALDQEVLAQEQEVSDLVLLV